MGAVPVLIRVVTDDVVPVPVDGILVQTYTDPGDVFYTSGITGVTGPGEIELTMDGDGPGIGYLVRMALQDHSFAGQPHSILVKDPPAPTNEFEFETHVGPTALVVKLVMKDSNDDPLDGARARVYDDTDTFLAEATTGDLAPGEVDFPLEGAPDPGQQYLVRWRPPLGYQVTGGNTKILQVLDPLVPPASNIFDFVSTMKEVPESPDPLMCRLSGYFIDAAKRPLKGVEITFNAREGYPDNVVSGFPYPGWPTVIGGFIMGAPQTKTVTDKNGFVMVDLPRKSVFDVHISGLETPGMNIVEPVYVPDLPGIVIQDVLFPYIVEVTYVDDPITVEVGKVEIVDLSIFTSNKQEDLSPVTGLIPLLDFETGDEATAVTELNGDGLVTVIGVAIGATTLEADRVVGSVAPRSPPVPDLIVVPPAVVVVAPT